MVSEGTEGHDYYYVYDTAAPPPAGRFRRDKSSVNVTCGWLYQCKEIPKKKDQCYPNVMVAGANITSSSFDFKLPAPIDPKAFIIMRYLVPVVVTVLLILLLIFILHLLFPYPTIDALVFSIINVGIMAYTTLTALDICNTDGFEAKHQWAFYLWIGADVGALFIILFIIIMCCTGCHF